MICASPLRGSGARSLEERLSWAGSHLRHYSGGRDSQKQLEEVVRQVTTTTLRKARVSEDSVGFNKVLILKRARTIKRERSS